MDQQLQEEFQFADGAKGDFIWEGENSRLWPVPVVKGQANFSCGCKLKSVVCVRFCKHQLKKIFSFPISCENMKLAKIILIISII